METEKELNKLMKETEMKLDKCKHDRRVVLIDFVRRYNEVWSCKSQKANNEVKG